MRRLTVAMRSRRATALGACLLVILVALAGCGGDSDCCEPDILSMPSSTGSSVSRSVAAPPCRNAGFAPLALQWTAGGGLEARGAGQAGAVLGVTGTFGVYSAAADGSRLDLIWDTPTNWGTHIGKSRYRLERVLSVSGSPDGTWVTYAGCLSRQGAGEATGADASGVRDYAAGPVQITVPKSPPDQDQEWFPHEFNEIMSWNRHTGATRPMALGRAPVWAPDSTRVAFVSGYDYGQVIATSRGGYRLWVMPAAGGQPREVARSVVRAAAWAPHSQRLAFLVHPPSEEVGSELHVAADDGTKQARLATNVMSPPAWSPDGRRLAYVRHEGETYALYTVGVDGADARRVTTIQGWGESPTGGWIPSVAWSPDGAHLLYSCGRQVCVVALDGTPVGKSPVGLNLGAWSPDGSRVAVAATDRPEPDDSGRRTSTITLASMAPDGSDVQPLVRWVGYQGSTVLVLWGGAPPPTPAPVDDCANGRVVPEPAANPGLVQDCRALMEARDVLKTYRRLNWDPTGLLGEWDGVLVLGSPPRVRALNLSFRDLYGRVPSAFGRLDALETLNLSRNGLKGPMPAALGNLVALRVLDLSGNRLSGDIPVELATLDDLQLLYLESNDLTGCIPAALREVPNNDLDAFPTCAAT